MTETATYLPESIDKTAPFTVAVTYCTGRVTVEYPVNMPVAVRNYTRKVTAAVRQDNIAVSGGDPEFPPVHIKRVDLLVRDREEPYEIKSHIDTRQDIDVCGCSPAACRECIDKWGKMPSPWGDSVQELESYREHLKTHNQASEPSGDTEA